MEVPSPIAIAGPHAHAHAHGHGLPRPPGGTISHTIYISHIYHRWLAAKGQPNLPRGIVRTQARHIVGPSTYAGTVPYRPTVVYPTST